MRRILSFLICLLQAFVFAEINGGKYTVIAPGTIFAEEKYTVTVGSHHTNKTCHIDVGITGPSLNLKQTVALLPNETKNVQFDVPNLINDISPRYELTAESDDCFENFKNSTRLLTFSTQYRIIVQTDKAFYTPGEVINYRVLIMDTDLKPFVGKADYTIVLTAETNGRSRTLMAKSGLKTENGMYLGNFTISMEHPMGPWVLEVFTNKIARYSMERRRKHVVPNGIAYSVNHIYVSNIFPKLVAKVEALEYGSIKGGIISVLVSANHVYGKPVDGTVTIALTFPGFNDVEEHTAILKSLDMVNGRANFSVDPTEYSDYVEKKQFPTRITIKATIEEKSTGEKIEANTHTNIYSYLYAMESITHEEFYFQPDKEIDVQFKLRYYNTTYINDTTSPVQLIYRDSIYRKDKSLLEYPKPNFDNFTFRGYMNEIGVVNFKVSLPKLQKYKHFVHGYSLSVKYLDEEQYIKSMYGLTTGNENEKVIEAKEDLILMEQAALVNKELHLNKPCQFTIKSIQPITYFDYNVIARGRIVKSGRINLSSKSEVYDLTLTPEVSWASNFAIYVYYVDENGKFHYAERKYHIDDPLNPITVRAPEHAKPGEEVTLSIQAAPNSFVGLMAIDQRIMQLENKVHILSRSSIEDLLNSRDTRTPHQRGLSKYPGTTSGCVTLTNADYYYQRRTRKGTIFNTHLFYPTYHPSKEPSFLPRNSYELDFLDDSNNEDFLKTLIFANFPNTTTADFSWSVKLPQAKTTWLLTAFSINPKKGLGIAENKIKVS